MGIKSGLSFFDLYGTATTAAVASDQFAVFYVERGPLDGFPLVKTTFTQGFAFVLLFLCGTLELNNVTHSVYSRWAI